MLKTFNCGVGFCLIVERKKINQKKNFLKKNLNLTRSVLFLNLQKKLDF